MKKTLVMTLAGTSLLGLAFGLFLLLNQSDPDALTDDQELMVRLSAQSNPEKAEELRQALREVNRIQRKMKDGTMFGPEEGQSQEDYAAERAARQEQERQQALSELDDHLGVLRQRGNRRFDRVMAISKLVKSQSRQAVLVIGEIAVNDPVYRLEHEARERIKRLDSQLRQAVLGLRPVSFWQSTDGEEMLYFLLDMQDDIPKDYSALFAGTPHPHDEIAYSRIYDHFWGPGAHANDLQISILSAKRDALKIAADEEKKHIDGLRLSQDADELQRLALESTTFDVYVAALNRLQQVDPILYVKTCLDLFEEGQPWWKHHRAQSALSFGDDAGSQANNVAILGLRPEKWWEQRPQLLVSFLTDIDALFDESAFPKQMADWSERAVNPDELSRHKVRMGWSTGNQLDSSELWSTDPNMLLEIVHDDKFSLTTRYAALSALVGHCQSDDPELAENAQRLITEMMAAEIVPTMEEHLRNRLRLLDNMPRLRLLSVAPVDDWLKAPRRRYLHVLTFFVDYDSSAAQPLTQQDYLYLLSELRPPGPHADYLSTHRQLMELRSRKMAAQSPDIENADEVLAFLQAAPEYFHFQHSNTLAFLALDEDPRIAHRLMEIAFDPTWARYQFAILFYFRSGGSDGLQKTMNFITSRPEKFWRSPAGERAMSAIRVERYRRKDIEEGSITWPNRVMSLDEFDRYHHRFSNNYTGQVQP